MSVNIDASDNRIMREHLYRFPWSKTDNCGGWVEVTDECDLTCDGCYRSRLAGHRPLEEIKKDISMCHEITRCDAMAIAGGEPLIYPHIVEVVEHIASRNIKPVILTNGQTLTRQFATDLKNAGLAKFHFHIDSGQKRQGWTGKNEVELNRLRQKYADLVWDIGGLQCGYNITVYRSTLKYLPEIVGWCRQNMHKVQHISLIAFRAIPLNDTLKLFARGKPVDLHSLYDGTYDGEEITITSEEMFWLLRKHFPDLRPCAYLGGTTSPETYKYLVAVLVGSKKGVYGVLGPKTVELVQIFFHLFKRRYCAFLRNPKAGKKLFLLSPFDREVRRTFANFGRLSLRNPLRFFENLYTQTLHFQQPHEIYDGDINLCDGCANMMIHNDRLINSCKLDEYRLFGEPVKAVKMKGREDASPING